MKKRLRKTGEIVEVYDFECGHEDPQDDFVAYTDSKGRNHFENGINLRDDFEEVGENEKAIDWEQVRIKASISALQGFASNPHGKCVDADTETLARWSVGAADTLIAELKKGGEK